MNRKRVPQFKIIRGTDDKQFQSSINNELREIENLVSIEFPEEQALVARIHYEIIIEEPENSEDRYYQKHNKHVLCCDCPHLEPDPDFRSKTHWCPLNQARVRMNDRACDSFCDGLMFGTDHMITPEERIQKMEAAHKVQIALRNEEKRQQRIVSSLQAKARREDRLEAPGAPRYVFEWYGTPPEELQNIENKELRPSEFNMVTDAIPKNATESTLVRLATSTNAELWKVAATGEHAQLVPEYVPHQVSRPQVRTK